MPGVPKVQRCQGCRRRKVKCDFKWPICTPCKRVKIDCSGPPKHPKFVFQCCDPTAGDSGQAQDGPGEGSLATRDEVISSKTTSSAAATSSSLADSRPWHAIKVGKLYKTSAPDMGASFGFFRLTHQPSATGTDRLTSYIVTQLAGLPDMDISLPYLRYLPARVAHSQALYDTLVVFCNSWTAYYRGYDPGRLIHPDLYGRALRSLRDALGGKDSLRIETLAAITIMQRIEVLFDIDRHRHRTVHSQGMIALVKARGLPEPDDGLELHLLYDLYSTLGGHWLVERGENFFLTSPWIERLEAAIKRISADDEDNVLGVQMCFELIVVIGQFPELVHLIRDVSQNPDREQAYKQATKLQMRLRDLMAEVSGAGLTTVEDAIARGAIIEKPSSECPSGTELDFVSGISLDLYLAYLVGSTTLALMAHGLSVVMGEPDEAVWAKYCAVAAQTPKVVPYLSRQCKLGSMLVITMLFLAFEGCAPEEQAYMRDYVTESDSYRKRFPLEKARLGKYMVYVARAMTGRRAFDLKPKTAADDIDL